MRAIDADELLKDPCFNDDSIPERAIFIQAVNECPTITPDSLVKRGRWVYHECVSSHDGTISGYSCSECSSFINEDIFDSDEFHKVFCGGCGSRMDLEGEG